MFGSHALRSDSIDLIDDSVLAPTGAELTRRPNVRRLLDFGIFHRSAGLLNKDNNATARFSVQLEHDRGRLTGDERQVATHLLPNLAKALDLGRCNRQFQSAYDVGLAAIEDLVVGDCLLDRPGRIVERNGEFARQMEASGVFAVAANGALRLKRPNDHARFERLRSDARHHGRFGARLRKETIATDSGGFLCIELVPLRVAGEIGTARFDGCILYSTDMSHPLRCDTVPMKAVFGLIDTELVLLDGIACGRCSATAQQRRCEDG